MDNDRLDSLRWVINAKCRTMDPEDFYVENLTPGRERLEAQILCAGCTVIPECARNAMEPIDVSQAIRQVSQSDLVEAPDLVPVSGVVRAGVVC